MIFVVEVPKEGEPLAWFAYDAEDLLTKVAGSDPLPWWEIHDQSTPRELIEMLDQDPADPGLADRLPALWSLVSEHGLDTPLYRADHLGTAGYQASPVSMEEACEAALKARVGSALQDVRIWWSEQEAVLASEDPVEPLFTRQGGWRCLHALREQLLALDVVAEN